MAQCNKHLLHKHEDWGSDTGTHIKSLTGAEWPNLSPRALGMETRDTTANREMD